MSAVSRVLPGSPEEFHGNYEAGPSLTISDFEHRDVAHLSDKGIIETSCDEFGQTSAYSRGEDGYGQRVAARHGLNTCLIASARTADCILSRAIGAIPKFAGATESEMIDYYGIRPVQGTSGYYFQRVYADLLRVAGYDLLSNRNPDTGLKTDIRSLNRVLASGGVGLLQTDDHVRLIGAASLQSRGDKSRFPRLRRKMSLSEDVAYQVWDSLAAIGIDRRYKAEDVPQDIVEGWIARSGTLIGTWKPKPRIRITEAETEKPIRLTSRLRLSD